MNYSLPGVKILEPRTKARLKRMVERCIYGVDLNPVPWSWETPLWIETMDERFPSHSWIIRSMETVWSGAGLIRWPSAPVMMDEETGDEKFGVHQRSKDLGKNSRRSGIRRSNPR